MKNFKEMLDRDMATTFYNTKEFAQLREIEYDGMSKKIPVIFDLEETKDRNGKDSAEGIYLIYTVIRVRLSDLEEEPSNGTRIWIDGILYTIESVQNEYNELIIDLKRCDE